MSRYHGARKSIIRQKDEATRSSAVFRRNLLLKRGQRGIRGWTERGRDDATGIRWIGKEGEWEAMRKYDVFLSFNFADKDPAGLSFAEVKTSKGRYHRSFPGHYLLHLPPLVKKHPVGLEIDFFCLERTKNGLRLLLGYRIIVLSASLCPGYGLEKDSLEFPK